METFYVDGWKWLLDKMILWYLNISNVSVFIGASSDFDSICILVESVFICF